MKALKIKIVFLTVFALLVSFVTAQDLTGVKIHINPGHGGWDSDDRGIPTPLMPSVGPEVGFWESQSNLDKGLQLRTMLEALGATVQMSRILNRTQDDLPLSQIVQMANEFQADFMMAIHSNAGSGTANHVLEIHYGADPTDTNIYNTYNPNNPTQKALSDKSRAISTEIAKNLLKNQITYWTSPVYNVSGDKTFARLFMGWSDGYGILRGLNVAGVISEGSMHDYIPETYRLMNMEYKWLEAWNFKKAFCTYFKQAEIPTGNIAGSVKDSRNLIMDGTYRKYGKDLLLPINGATLTVLETGQTYTVDNKRNGVYVFKDLQPGDYNVKVEAEGYYAQTKFVKVLKNEHNYLNFELNKMRNTPPQVIKYSPNVAINDSVLTSIDIVLEFNWDMDETSTRAAFSISPAVEGKLTFEDSQYRLRFTPNIPLEKSTVYTVKLDKSAKHPDNMSLTEDFIFHFTTQSRNRLMFLDGYPNNGNKGVYAEKPLFWFIFDKKLTTANIRDEINIYDVNNTAISKATRSVKINKIGGSYGDISFELTEKLTAGKKYKVIIGGDAMDATGIKLVDPVEINFTASNVAVTDKTIIEDFEVDGKYTYEVAQSQNIISASITKSTTQKLFGTSGYKINAVFLDENAWSIFKINEPSVTTATSKVFGLHVYGDMSGNELQLQFRSEASENEVRYLKICDLNFFGWEFVEAQFSELESYKLTGIRIVRKKQLLSASTEIYVDNLLQYATSISSLNLNKSNNGIRIYPNPCKDILHVSVQNNEKPLLQLYSINGIMLREIQAAEMNVNDIISGTYILKIKLKDTIFSYPLMIVK
ncbi:MAG: T9SS type A sorting domain-containing protein [Paludibacter sp.]|nr:T9SS type A sorting domain-containing protein [Paludibacter sp.]